MTRVGRDPSVGWPLWARPIASGAPHPVLRPFLSRDYWAFIAAPAPLRPIVPASASVSVVLRMDDAPQQPSAFLTGVHDRYAVIDRTDASTVLQITMAPLGAYQLLGRPVHELGPDLVELTSVFGTRGRRLLEAVREQSTWSRRFAVVDAFLLRAAERAPAPSPEVTRALQLLGGTGGLIPIGDVAVEVGWSRKHLIAKFVQQIGLTPKTVARLTRFERVLTQVKNGRPLRWDEVAFDMGYSDQPHLIREFRDFAGTTPTGYGSVVSAERRDHVEVS